MRSGRKWSATFFPMEKVEREHKAGDIAFTKGGISYTRQEDGVWKTEYPLSGAYPEFLLDETVDLFNLKIRTKEVERQNEAAQNL